MKPIYLAAVAAAVLASAPAAADTFYNTGLQNLNGASGTSTYTTTTNANGTTTTVVGPGPNADVNRAHGTPVLNSWYQDNVGAGTTVGITTNYARNGDGSAYYNAAQAQTGKADLQYYFGSNGAIAPVALSSLTSYAYDYLRDSSSTATANLAPVLRLNILKNGADAGFLIWEPVYNVGNGPSPTNTWLTGSGTLTFGNWWSNSAALGSTPQTVFQTLQQWINANAGSTLSVYGINVGIGSGWDGTFKGAVDNVNVQFGQTGYSTNFEVASTTPAVPEPASWALMVAGFGLAGFALRARRASAPAIA